MDAVLSGYRFAVLIAIQHFTIIISKLSSCGIGEMEVHTFNSKVYSVNIDMYISRHNLGGITSKCVMW